MLVRATDKHPAQTAALEKAKPEGPESLEKRVEAHAHFLAGLGYEQNQEIDKALAELAAAARLSPRIEVTLRYTWATAPSSC